MENTPKVNTETAPIAGVEQSKPVLTNLGYLPSAAYAIGKDLGIAKKIKIRNKNVFQLKNIYRRYANLREIILLEILRRTSQVAQ